MRRSLPFLFVLLLAGCVGIPEPLPTPRTFLSPMQYLPLATQPEQWGRGAAATYSDIDACGDAQRIGARWLYNWSNTPPVCPGIVSLPMTWTTDLTTCPVFAPESAPILLWNEPGNAAQWGTPLAPVQAAKLTWHLTEECYPARKFIAPAEFNGGPYDGMAWKTAWWQAHLELYGVPPRVMLDAVHCYASTAQECITKLGQNVAWAQARGLKTLVTEWGIPPRWAGSTEAAMREADMLLHWLRSQPRIVGEAWFSTRQDGSEWWAFGGAPMGLCDVQSGALTPWGQWYQAH